MQLPFSFRLMQPVYVYSQQLPEGVNFLLRFNGVEGPSYILTYEDALQHNLTYTFPCRCLVLNQKTDLSVHGITSKIATALAQEKIPCNVVAAFHHDYFFVPKEKV